MFHHTFVIKRPILEVQFGQFISLLWISKIRCKLLSLTSAWRSHFLISFIYNKRQKNSMKAKNISLENFIHFTVTLVTNSVIFNLGLPKVDFIVYVIVYCRQNETYPLQFRKSISSTIMSWLMQICVIYLVNNIKLKK